MKKSFRCDDKPYDDNVYCALIYDGVVLEYAAEYLKSCMKRFAENDKGDFRTKTAELRKVFQLFSGKENASGEEQIRRIVSFIEDYKRELFQEMAKEGNDNELSGKI